MVKQELLKVADVRAELALVAAEYVRRYHAKVDTSKARVRVGTDKLSKKELNMVVEYLRRFPYVPSQLKISDVLRNIVGKQLNVRATYDTLMRNEWIIAAPVDTMTNNTTIELYSEYSEMKKRIIEDPIIFKASKIGAVIVTMWDKEAEDSMFDKYR